jgi:hypothetical protein
LSIIQAALLISEQLSFSQIWFLKYILHLNLTSNSYQPLILNVFPWSHKQHIESFLQMTALQILEESNPVTSPSDQTPPALPTALQVTWFQILAPPCFIPSKCPLLCLMSKSLMSEAPVVHACNPSYSGGRDQRIEFQIQPWQLVL